jgi:hypothetical protein
MQWTSVAKSGRFVFVKRSFMLKRFCFVVHNSVKTLSEPQIWHLLLAWAGSDRIEGSSRTSEIIAVVATCGEDQRLGI